jgi:hypothetical protein
MDGGWGDPGGKGMWAGSAGDGADTEASWNHGWSFSSAYTLCEFTSWSYFHCLCSRERSGPEVPQGWSPHFSSQVGSQGIFLNKNSPIAHQDNRLREAGHIKHEYQKQALFTLCVQQDPSKTSPTSQCLFCLNGILCPRCVRSLSTEQPEKELT